MLQLRKIKKQYTTGELTQTALDNLTLSLRDNEFVAVLGPSGSGKTTLLNIIGGLDRYDSGDLIINDISTKNYKDRDWDSYRNHTIGFVFQSYNLIPHQSVLSNVELALTISGVPHAERRKRAKSALEKVGLGDQLHKKPNQLSGGQMQRVAIARALVNNPDILLADEPTGALDSETGIQVMELLKEVAKDRLVVMVTHNPELAEKYASRTVKLRDGKITEDSNPYDAKDEVKKLRNKNMGKARMSFLTSLTLSFNNLKTKKGRTLLTSFAGSIGIIGIALIIALSSGVNGRIADIQKETMTSYPITISAESLNMSNMMSMRFSQMGDKLGTDNTPTDKIGVFADSSDLKNDKALSSNTDDLDLTAFKKYLDNPESEIAKYLGQNGVLYSYNVGFNIWSYDENEKLVRSDADASSIISSSSESNESSRGKMTSMFHAAASSSGTENSSELMPGNGSEISSAVTDSYDMLYGRWPSDYDEVVLKLDENNSVSCEQLYQLGLISGDKYKEISKQIEDKGTADEIKWDYEDVCNHNFYMLPSAESYVKNDNGTWSFKGDDTLYIKDKIDDSLKLKIVGVIRQSENEDSSPLSTTIGYTKKLTDYIISKSNDSEIVKAQESTPDINVLTGTKFEEDNDDQKVNDAVKYLSGLCVSDKASFYDMVAYTSHQDASTDTTEHSQATSPKAPVKMDESAKAKALDSWLSKSPDKDLMLTEYDEYLTGASYKQNMSDFGQVKYDDPTAINIYADSFEDKDAIANCITNYNKTVDSDSQITYTDYVALLTSSMTSIVDVISYVLIAFVAVSLIVSCIMIGIITHISVMERTKEIGILRALGASKHNISQVFNAETFIIGLCSGVLGIIISMLLTIPINAILASILGAGVVNASLPILYALALIVISLAITVVAGLLPAKKAAKKDPVIALRTE